MKLSKEIKKYVPEVSDVSVKEYPISTNRKVGLVDRMGEKVSGSIFLDDGGNIVNDVVVAENRKAVAMHCYDKKMPVYILMFTVDSNRSDIRLYPVRVVE